MTVIVTCPKCHADLRPFMRQLWEGKKNPKWRGDSVKYSGIHMWVYRAFGRAVRCEKCGKTKKRADGRNGIQWANISGEYKRERKDWIMLCAKCHSLERKNHGPSKYAKK